MYVVSVNVRFGGSNVADRAGRIARSVKHRVPNFESVLFFVQECSAGAMRSIRREVGLTHEAFARRGYRPHIGPFVATFVPRSWGSVPVSWRPAPYTKMWRDYHTVSVSLPLANTTTTTEENEKENENEKEDENENEKENENENENENKDEKKRVDVYNVHLESCKENRPKRRAQVASIARQSSGPFTILGDLNERVKHVSRGLETRTVATWRVRGTDHKARLYRVTTL